ncbi:RDD family protein [Campylobacter majalis]|uniref:RDD family protein n=1 Tax=Campylobacter majalis TaxID=2790656 RepID=UPI003D68403F
MSKDIAYDLEREGIKVASFSKRAFAFVVDEIVLALLFMAIYYERFSIANSQEEVVAIVMMLSWQYVLIRTIYHAFFVWYNGATVGKILMKIVCIDVGYLDKPNLSSSIMRALIRNVSEMAFYLGYLWAFGSPMLQTWHDRFAKTVVIDVA